MSNLEFKFGSEDNPKGHAIIYFEEFDDIFASYVINFPIKGELSKYIPEMFKDQIPDEEMTKMVFPPVPEKFNGNNLFKKGSINDSFKVLHLAINKLENFINWGD